MELSEEQKEICKSCFNYFIETENIYKPSYNILKYKILRRQFLLYSEIYYNNCANVQERTMYENIIKQKRNNKFEQLKNKYYEAFITYIKNEDNEEYYNKIAVSSRVSIQTAKRYPMHYYDKYATEEEKNIYNEIKMQKKLQNTKIEKESTKKISNKCIEIEFSEDETTEQTLPNISKNDTDYNNKSIEEKNNYSENNARYVKIFNNILAMDKIEDILLYLIGQKNLNRTYLKTSINPYLITYPETDINKLNKIVDIYYNYISHRNEKETIIKQHQEEKNKKLEQQKKLENKKILNQKKKIYELIKIVKDYNNTNYLNYIDYCREKNISLKKFDLAVKVTSKLDNETYIKFINKLKKYYQNLYSQETEVIFRIIIEMKNRKKFDLIDYYNITKMNMRRLNIIAKKICKKNDYILFNSFYEKYKNDELVNPSLLIKASYLINSYGNQVELDRKQKMKIINSLVKEDIPITKYTYLEMIKKELEEKPKQKQKVA